MSSAFHLDFMALAMLALPAADSAQRCWVYQQICPLIEADMAGTHEIDLRELALAWLTFADCCLHLQASRDALTGWRNAIRLDTHRSDPLLTALSRRMCNLLIDEFCHACPSETVWLE